MVDQPPPQAGQVFPKMEIPADLELTYVNLVRIAHSPMDMVFDFAQLVPGGDAQVKSRVIMSPAGAKLLLRALAENISKYEASYGEIQLPGDKSLASYLFRSPDRDRT